MLHTLRAAILLVSLLLTASATADTTFILVRHAEKITGTNDVNPSLSRAGEQRAQDLARLLSDVDIDMVYPTTMRTDDGTVAITRTWKTADPISIPRKIPTNGYEASSVDSVITHAFENHRDGTVLIVGHSNTIPQLIELLGVRAPVTMTEEDYDDIFFVRIDGNGTATMMHLHYGKPSV
ncbi:MAG: hypothetical protein ACYTF7_00110 [Planctomycetota bacterium]|jgi:broad specificity phosphatase PhoE